MGDREKDQQILNETSGYCTQNAGRCGEGLFKKACPITCQSVTQPNPQQPPPQQPQLKCQLTKTICDSYNIANKYGTYKGLNDQFMQCFYVNGFQPKTIFLDANCGFMREM